MKLKLAAILLILAASSVNAGVTDSKIKHFTTNYLGDVLFGTTQQPSGTCNYQSWYFKLDSSSAGADKMFSVLMAAKLADKTVRISYNDSPVAGTTSPTCNVTTLSEVTTISIE